MDGIFSNWKFWLFIMQFLTMSFSGFAFLIIKFNDFKHLEDSMKIQNSTIKGLADAIILQGKQIAKIEGILEIKE